MKTRRYQHEKDYFTYEMYSESYKEVSEKAGLKPIQKTKKMEFGSITSRQTEREKVETLTDFMFLGSKITAYDDCSHDI